MEPTPKGGVLDDLARQLFGPGDPAVQRRRRRVVTVSMVRSVAFDVSMILGLAMTLGAYLALVIWLWITVI
jgi:hypothetical protein